MSKSPIKSPLSEADKEITGNALQATLVDLVDLSLIAKQAHWNVVGSNFRSAHLQLDELVATARQYVDEVAERANAIGISPNGKAKTVVESWACRSTRQLAVGRVHGRRDRRHPRGAHRAAAAPHRRDRQERPRHAGPADRDHPRARRGALDVAGPAGLIFSAKGVVPVGTGPFRVAALS